MKASQKKSIIVGIVVVILALAAWAVFFGSGGERTVSISSDDDFLSISWPEGAFPEGISSEDVSMIKRPAEENIAVYEFLPDGAVFTEPGMLSLTIPAPVEGEPLPLLMLVGEGDPEILETHFKYSDDLSEVAVTAPISHFSRLVIVRGVFELIRPAEKAVYPVGANFTIRIPIFVNSASSTAVGPRGLPLVLANATVRHIGTATSPVVVDKFLVDWEEAVISNFFTAVEEGFICKQEGIGSAIVNIDFEYNFHWGPAERGRLHIAPGLTVEYPQGVSCTSFEEEDDDTEGFVDSSGSDFKQHQFKALMIESGGIHYPVTQFDIVDSPDSGCSRPHYRAKHDAIYGLEDLSETTVLESAFVDMPGCGFGRYDSLERINVVLTFDQVSALKEKIIEPLY